MKIKILLFILLLLVLGGIGFWYVKNIRASNLKTENFTIKELPASERYYANTEAPIDINREDLKNDFNQKAGISYVPKEGAKYNPVTVSHIIISLLESYRKNQDKAYLEKAEVYAQGLLKTAVKQKNALFFPYNFTFTTHNYKDRLEKPWYSGMAQGQILTAFVKLYNFTNKSEYLEAADKTFLSLKLLKQDNTKIWVSLITKDGFYWVEEYPQEKPDYTLNGFLYAAIGLYDYYLLEKSPESEKYLIAALTTAKAYLPKYRNPGGTSFYCLKHKTKNTKYHKTHIQQMQYLYKITGDEFFKNMAENFSKDRP